MTDLYIKVIHDGSGVTVLCRGPRAQCEMLRLVTEAALSMAGALSEAASMERPQDVDVERLAELVLEAQRRLIKKLEELSGGAGEP